MESYHGMLACVSAGAGLALGDLHAHPGTGMAKAMGQADHPRHHVAAGLHLDLDFPDPRADPHPLAILQLAAGQVIRMHQQLVTRLAFHQAMVVVHPGIVAAHMAAPNQQQLARHWGRHLRQAVQVVQQDLRGCFDSLADGRQAPSEVAA
ncbi:hypothetical protein D9M71_704240 [compost metagenome]